MALRRAAHVVADDEPLDAPGPGEVPPERVGDQPDPVADRGQHPEVCPRRAQHLHAELCRQPVAEVRHEEARDGDAQHEEPPAAPELLRIHRVEALHQGALAGLVALQPSGKAHEKRASALQFKGFSEITLTLSFVFSTNYSTASLSLRS